MKKMCKVLAIMAGAGLLVAVPSAVFAICPDSEPLWNGAGGFFTSCPDAAPVAAYAYALSGPSTINTNGMNFICIAGSGVSDQNVPCQPEAGVAGDGNVTVQFNWGGPGPYLGCPNPSFLPDTGRNVLQIIANNGSSATVSINFEPGTSSYLVEGAMQTPDGASFTPIACDFGNTPQLTSSSAGVSPSLSQVCIHAPAPHIASDCDPGTLGQLIGTCTTAIPSTAPGKVYTINSACGSSPDPRRSLWTAAGTPDASGNACIPVAKPATGCTFVGVSGTINGVETDGILGSFQVAGANASTPKAVIDKVGEAKGLVSVDFHTTSELGAVGFNILAGGRVLNAQLIAATGVGGAGSKYHFEVGRGVLKNDRTIVVQTKTSSGGTINSDAATLSK